MTAPTSHDGVIIDTPLGELAFRVLLNGTPPVPGDGAFNVSVRPVEPLLPSGMSVEGCYGVVLNVRPARRLGNLCFECRWLNVNAKCTAPETGEGLDAQGWQTAGHIALVGTEDQEFMASRLPSAVVLDYPVRYSEDGITIHIHALPKAMQISLHFVVAWNPNPEPVEATCWYAVGMPHVTVLSQVCKG